jgi:hypothetical protein
LTDLPEPAMNPAYCILREGTRVIVSYLLVAEPGTHHMGKAKPPSHFLHDHATLHIVIDHKVNNALYKQSFFSGI